MIPYQTRAIIPYQPIDFYDLAVQETKKTLKGISDELDSLNFKSDEFDPPNFTRFTDKSMNMIDQLEEIVRRFDEAVKGFEKVLEKEITAIRMKIKVQECYIFSKINWAVRIANIDRTAFRTLHDEDSRTVVRTLYDEESGLIDDIRDHQSAFSDVLGFMMMKYSLKKANDVT